MRTIRPSGLIVAASLLFGLGAQATPMEPTAAGDADSRVSRLERAEVTYDRKQLQLSIDAYTRLIEAEPEVASHHYMLARSYFPLIDIYEADGYPERADEIGEKGLAVAEEAVRLDPDGNADAVRLLGDFYGRLTPFKGVWSRMRYGSQSNKLHTQALEMDPENPRAVIGVGTDKLYAPSMLGGDLEGAAGLFKQAIAMAPDLAAPHVWLARAYNKLEQPDLARQALQAALALEPASGIALIDSSSMMTADTR